MRDHQSLIGEPMNKLMTDVTTFHLAAEHPVAITPNPLPEERVQLRLRMILEEVEELLQATTQPSHDLEAGLALLRRHLSQADRAYTVSNSMNSAVDYYADVADALVDITYLVVGMGVEMGLPLPEVWQEVQRANMDKFPDGKVLRREDGKVMKPEGWKPPDVRSVLQRHMRKSV
jgi:predicted HAD superfamily Cof-like phosphohydrolase